MTEKRITVRNRLTLTPASSQLARRILEETSVKNPVYSDLKKYSPYEIPFWVKPKIQMSKVLKDGAVSIPRGYDFKAMGGPGGLQAHGFRVIDDTVTAPVDFPSWEISPNDLQIPVLDKLQRELERPTRLFHNFLLVLPTATGKTVLAAMAASLMGQKTLVLTHRQLVANSWKRDLIKTYGFKESDIGLIQGSKATIGAQFTVAYLQTMFKKKLSMLDDLKEEFGTVIFDECHLAPAKTFHSVVDAWPSKFRVGLTATPERGDGLDDVIFLTFGVPFVEIKGNVKSDTAQPITDVVVRNTGIELEDKYGGTLIQMCDIDKALQENVERNLMIVEDVKREAMAGHSCLVVCKRRDHVYALIDLLRRAFVHAEPLEGRRSKKQIAATEQALIDRRVKVAVGTIQLTKVGASINPLDRLFLAGSIGNKKDTEQIAGRIRRAAPGKTDAVIYDYVDSNPVLWNHFKRRRRVYASFGLEKFKNMFLT